MSLEARLLWLQRWAVIVAVAGGALAVRVADGDIFSLPKSTLIALCALSAVVVAASRVALTGRLSVARRPELDVAVVLAAAFALVTATSTIPAQSLVGQYSQGQGLLQYGSYLVLYLTVLSAFRDDGVTQLLHAVVVAGLVVSGYGVVQWTGSDPVDWSTGGGVFSFLGNPNFLAGWCGIVAPLGAMVALRVREPDGWRLAGAATALGVTVVALATRSFQGPMTVAASLGFLAVLVGWPHARRLRTTRRASVAAGMVLVVVAVVAGPRAVDATRAGIDDGLLERRYFWAVAVETGFDHPIVGTGLDTFHEEFLPRRPAAHSAIPASKNAGAAHDVPLDHFANGGLVLLLAYLAFVGLTARRLLVGLRRAEGDRALVLAGVGAAWVGYQVQSLVSMDRPTIAVLHFVLAGLVHVLVGGSEVTEDRPQQRRAGRRLDQHAISGRGVAVSVLVVAVGTLAAYFLTQPFRADLAYGSGVDRLASEPELAVRDLERARRLLPSEARYTYDLSRAYLQTGQAPLALDAAIDGFRLEPGDSSYAVYAASVAEQVGDAPGARQLLRAGVRVDPFGLDPLLALARFEAVHGRPRKARALVDRALEVTRARADVWERVAEVYAVLGDQKRAAEARAEMRSLGG